MELNQIFTLTVNPSIDREWIVDSLDFDRVLHSLESHIDVGGKGFNVSRMLNTLGVKTTALGFVGGKNGEFLQDGLQSLGIDTDFIWIKGNSRTNISVTNHQNNHYIKINEPGPKISAERQNQLIEKIKTLARGGDCWVLSGSLPPCVPPDYYAKLIEIIHGKGAKVILDTSGEALAHGCVAAPFMIKPNSSELQELTRMPVDDTNNILNAVDQLHQKGIQIIIVSMGSQGAILSAQEGSWWSKNQAVQERNPIGAGDSLIGGFLWSLKQGYSLQDSLGWGVACGTASASLDGTDVGSKADIERLHTYNQIQRIR